MLEVLIKISMNMPLETAEIPDDTSGLNEFGMGMKTASSWLANKWTVTTSAFGENYQRSI